MTDTLLPKNDDDELLELIDDAFDAYYGDTLWDDDQKHAKYHDFTRGELLTILKARDTKMLEQARLEERIRIYKNYGSLAKDEMPARIAAAESALVNLKGKSK